MAIFAVTAAAQTGDITFISYAAMRRGTIPCPEGGSPKELNRCYQHVPSNEYTRGCTKIERCARHA